MSIALLTLHEWWASQKKAFDSIENYQKFIYEYYTYLSNKVLILFFSTSDNLDDTYNLFTVLNSGGLQLQSSDILRAQSLRVIEEEATRKKYAAKWDAYQSATESPYKSFDKFLWAIVYLLMKYRSDSNQSLSKAFTFIYDKGLLTCETQMLDFIGKYVEHLDAVISNDFQFEEAECLYENLNYILATTYGNQHTVLLMHYRECFGEFNILDFLIKIDNLFSVSWLIDTRNLQTRIFIIVRKMEEVRDTIGDRNSASLAFLDDDVLRYDYGDEKANTCISLEKFFSLLDEEQ